MRDAEERKTHDFTKVVNRVAEEGGYAEIVSAQHTLFGVHVREVDAGEVEQRVLVVWRVFAFAL